jgi:hypothetical protein
MNRSPLRRARFAAVFAILGLLAFAASASASQISLKCGGKGPRNRDSAGTILCAEPGKSRLVTGSLRNDAGKAVAGKVAVTVSNWIPTGEGSFKIVAGKPQTIAASAAGKFSYLVKTATKVSVKFEALGDEALGVSPVAAQADVSRQLLGRVKKLGGGRVKITVKGTTQRLKIAVTDEYGYEVAGGKLRKASKGGSAVFDLGNVHGKFSYYVDAGELGDLFWYGRPPSFRL